MNKLQRMVTIGEDFSCQLEDMKSLLNEKTLVIRENHAWALFWLMRKEKALEVERRTIALVEEVFGVYHEKYF